MSARIERYGGILNVSLMFAYISVRTSRRNTDNVKNSASTPIFSEWSTQASRELTGPRAAVYFKRLLEGYGLPRIDNYTEADVRLLQLIEEQPELSDVITDLARRLLEEHVANAEERSASPIDTDRKLFSLLYLSAGLKAPDRLARPLKSIFRKRLIPLTSNYRGVPLTLALCAALIHNQDDDTLASVWAEMRRDQPNYLSGTPQDGERGQKLMPSREPPAVCVVGESETEQVPVVQYYGEDISFSFFSGKISTIFVPQWLYEDSGDVTPCVQGSLAGFFGTNDDSQDAYSRHCSDYTKAQLSYHFRDKKSPMSKIWFTYLRHQSPS